MRYVRLQNVRLLLPRQKATPATSDYTPYRPMHTQHTPFAARIPDRDLYIYTEKPSLHPEPDIYLALSRFLNVKCTLILENGGLRAMMVLGTRLRHRVPGLESGSMAASWRTRSAAAMAMAMLTSPPYHRSSSLPSSLSPVLLLLQPHPQSVSLTDSSPLPKLTSLKANCARRSPCCFHTSQALGSSGGICGRGVSVLSQSFLRVSSQVPSFSSDSDFAGASAESSLTSGGIGFLRGRTEASMSASGASETFVPQAAGSTVSGQGNDQQHVIVVGGGVIGCCTAYYLGKLGVKVTVVEKTEIACAASGKAGGFLALDWCDGGAVQGLARASFALHEQLADELDGKGYGYRRVGSLSVSVEEPRSPQHASERVPKAGTPAWIDGSIKGAPSAIGTPSTNAQVHPQLFTRAIFSEAQKKYGASLLIGAVQEVKVEGKKVIGVVVDGKLVTGDAVVLAMGPWSSRNPLISSLTTISGLKAHSIVLLPKDVDAISAHTLFLKYKTREGKSMDPEIYPRGTGEVYVCGMSEEVEVPEDARQIVPRDESTVMLQRVAATVSSHLADAKLSVAQACFLPCSEDNVPVIGKLPDLEGAYVATGHSCWGILNAPATGAALAELIVNRVAKTCSLKPFDPFRFARFRTRQ